MGRGPVLDWLMEGDASIRWQALRDLAGAEGRTWERWLIENRYPGKVFFEMEAPGTPSRWNTLRALRVLRWRRQ